MSVLSTIAGCSKLVAASAEVGWGRLEKKQEVGKVSVADEMRCKTRAERIWLSVELAAEKRPGESPL
jgi:hypothetical protein